MKTRFQSLQARATLQECVLEREAKGYSLYSNRTFTQADCASLDEVAECLAFDPSFVEAEAVNS